MYCGQTNNLKKRLKEHNSRTSRSAKYTKGRQPVTLVYIDKTKTRSQALRREYEIKQLTKKQKEALTKT